ncbi:putative CocE/NonD family hydrolase [Pedobacter sp. UYP30]|uniref:CocE/NonD family hydrolase n=1 Tax=Pedobacter sp. UYP30 TaxID=1756400 RepID=UPI003393DF5F
MKKILLTFATALLLQTTFAQNLYFPAKNYKDSLLFNEEISGLARQVIAKYNEENKLSYFDNIFRLQIASGDYKLAKNALDSLISILGKQWGDTVSTKAIGFAFQVYLANKLNDVGKSESFANYKPTFRKLYNALGDEAKSHVGDYFSDNVLTIASDLKALRESLSKSDSLSLANAILLCRNYVALEVYGKTQSLGSQILLHIETEKYISNDSVLLKMPDGGTISLTFYRDRKVTTPQPVVLQYNIYAGNDASACKLAVKNGFIGVVANTRGKRLSLDDLEPFERDAKDAYTIIDWISKQSWCNGKIGMYGGSYLGFAQWSATKYLHPALKTIVPQAAVAPGIDFPVLNGIFPIYLLRYLHFVMDNKLIDLSGFLDDKKWNDLAGKWYQNGSSFRSLDRLEGRPNKIYQRMLNHPTYDSFFQNMIPQREEFAKINIPILTTTGYYDDDQLGAMYYYKQYHQWNKNPNDYLIIGPFDHGGSQYKPAKILGGYHIDSVANISIIDIVFKWFDYILKDGKRPDILKDRVNFEVMGTNNWWHVSTLDQMHNDSLVFYLGNKIVEKTYPLVKAKPVKVSFIDQTVDMRERSDLRFRQDDIIAFTQLINTELLPEKEKLVFVSEPVDGSFAISGALSATINLSINKKDIDLILDLYEQTADGKYFALNESIQRASLAKDRTKKHLLTPDKIETVVMDRNFIISKKLEKGSRIVALLGVNKSPNWQVNYGTGKDVSDETMADAKIPLKIKWYSNSRIKIPILKL